MRARKFLFSGIISLLWVILTGYSVQSQTFFMPGIAYTFEVPSIQDSTIGIIYTVIYQTNGTADIYRTFSTGTMEEPASFALGNDMQFSNDVLTFGNITPGFSVFILPFTTGFPSPFTAIGGAVRYECPCGNMAAGHGICVPVKYTKPPFVTVVYCRSAIFEPCEHCGKLKTINGSITYDEGVLVLEAAGVNMHN